MNHMDSVESRTLQMLSYFARMTKSDTPREIVPWLQNEEPDPDVVDRDRYREDERPVDSKIMSTIQGVLATIGLIFVGCQVYEMIGGTMDEEKKLKEELDQLRLRRVTWETELRYNYRRAYDNDIIKPSFKDAERFLYLQSPLHRQNQELRICFVVSTILGISGLIFKNWLQWFFIASAISALFMLIHYGRKAYQTWDCANTLKSRIEIAERSAMSNRLPISLAFIDPQKAVVT